MKTVFTSTNISIRYITDQGYNAASDSESIVDIQKIIKRLLDVRIAYGIHICYRENDHLRDFILLLFKM